MTLRPLSYLQFFRQNYNHHFTYSLDTLICIMPGSIIAIRVAQAIGFTGAAWLSGKRAPVPGVI